MKAKRTNIILSEKQHKTLKEYARAESRTMGELIRDAVDRIYQKVDRVERRKEIALGAYREGLVSLGRLAEVLGMDPVSTRNYLKEKRIPLQTQDREAILQDIRNA